MPIQALKKCLEAGNAMHFSGFNGLDVTQYGRQVGITGGLVFMTEDKCVFCDIVSGAADAHIIHQDELSIAILDTNPLARGHCLVIPKRHVPWWHDLTRDETESLFSVARVTAQMLMRSFQPDFVCMYARGRRIPHTHIFLVPTYSGDPVDRFFNALEGFQENACEMASYKADLEDTAKHLREGN